MEENRISFKRKVDSQTSGRKKIKIHPGRNHLREKVSTAVVADENSFVTDIFEGMLKFMSTNDERECRNVLFGTSNVSEQDQLSKQQIRYYWKQALLFSYEEMKRKRLAISIINDGSFINQLDDYCLEKIFKYLPLEERLKTGQVCQQWKRVLEHAWSDVKELDYNYIDYGGENYNENTSNQYAKIKRLVVSIFKLIHHCSRYLKKLNLTCLQFSHIMPAISLNCLDLDNLKLRFRVINAENFIDAFCFMSDLKSLEVSWNNNMSMPVTFIEALDAVTDTLEKLKLTSSSCLDSRNQSECNDFPDSWISIFRRFRSLRNLVLDGYNLDNEMIQAISQKKELIKLHLQGNLDYYWNSHNPIIYPISSLKNLEHLNISDFTLTNNFLITLADNSKNLKCLSLDCSYISDVGIIALTNLKKLEEFIITLNEDVDTVDITDHSIGKFKNMKIMHLSKCTKITDLSIIKVLENCPELKRLDITRTGITEESVKQAARIRKGNNVALNIDVHLAETSDDLYINPEYISPWLTVNNLY